MQPFSLDVPGLFSDRASSLRSLSGLPDGNRLKIPDEESDQFAPSFSPGRGSFAFERRISIEIEYQSIRAMKFESGEIVYERTSVQFRAVEVYREVGGLDPAAEEASSAGLFDVLRNYFSPERTAERIANFAINRFQPQGQEGSEEATARRERFRSLILPAVRRGADEAASALTGMPEEIIGIADRVYDLVAQLFDRFVEEGDRPVLLK